MGHAILTKLIHFLDITLMITFSQENILFHHFSWVLNNEAWKTKLFDILFHFHIFLIYFQSFQALSSHFTQFEPFLAIIQPFPSISRHFQYNLGQSVKLRKYWICGNISVYLDHLLGFRAQSDVPSDAGTSLKPKKIDSKWGVWRAAPDFLGSAKYVY